MCESIITFHLLFRLVSLFYYNSRDEKKLGLENDCEGTLNSDLEITLDGAMYLKYRSWREGEIIFIYEHTCMHIS